MALLGCLRAIAQGASPEDLARLIEGVHAGDRHGDASRRLLELGAPAAAAMTAALDPTDVVGTRALLGLIGELGPDATEAVPVLAERVESGPEELQPDFARALARLLPYLPRTEYMQRRYRLWRLLAAQFVSCKEEEIARRFAREWNRALLLKEKYSAPTHDVATLQVVAAGWDHKYGAELACELLGRKGAAADTAVDTLRAVLDRGFSRSVVWTKFRTERIRYMSGPTSSRVVAAAILRIRPDGEDAMAAHTYLLEHGLRHERWNALEFVRAKAPGVDAAVICALIRVASDADDAELLAEVVTTLGALGDAAAAAVPRLEELAAGPDEALARRASAALRAIRGREQR